MRPGRVFIQLLAALLITAGLLAFIPQQADITSYTADPKKEQLQFFLKDDKGQVFRNIGNLNTWLKVKKKTLIFAMNGGMYMTNNMPVGLYVENGRQLSKLNTRKDASGNFYMQPNGVFYIAKDGTAAISKTITYKPANVKYATQSGPVLVIDGAINPLFKEGSANLNIRNGVGILPGNKILFAISDKEINFYDFAKYFRDKGCKNALYLDGFVSRMYYPAAHKTQNDGNLGVLIAIVK